MAAYRLEWKRSALKDLHRIARKDVARIVRSVESLANNPFPSGAMKLAGGKRSHRIRVGNYRVLYDVVASRLVIQVIKVGHWKDVYR